MFDLVSLTLVLEGLSIWFVVVMFIEMGKAALDTLKK